MHNCLTTLDKDICRQTISTINDLKHQPINLYTILTKFWLYIRERLQWLTSTSSARLVHRTCMSVSDAPLAETNATCCWVLRTLRAQFLHSLDTLDKQQTTLLSANAVHTSFLGGRGWGVEGFCMHANENRTTTRAGARLNNVSTIIA